MKRMYLQIYIYIYIYIVCEHSLRLLLCALKLETEVSNALPTTDNTILIFKIHSKKLWCRRMHKNIVCESSLRRLLCTLKT
jgi:hypothetical protein